MFKQYRLILLLASICLICLCFVSLTQAQENYWGGPRRLSNPDVVEASEGLMVADQYGLVHTFWTEKDPVDSFNTLQYAVYDGESWSDPIDIRVTPPDFLIPSFSAAVDNNGLIHLVLSQGNTGPVFYMNAPAHDALAAPAWSEPIKIEVPGQQVKIQVDSEGILHVLYANIYATEPGIYYMRSTDLGETWSPSRWLDPDTPVTDSPNALRFVIDEADGLHALWYYADLNADAVWGKQIRYIHSLDSGETWSLPFTIDEADDTDDELRIPYPGLGVAGETVHAIWAGNSQTEREHAFSLDRGVTWSETYRVFGSLQGQALGDDLIADAAGRLHFFGQVRWPQGLYHVVWSPESGWSEPSMIYLIRRTADQDRIGYHAHNIRATIRAGNQLIVTFTDEAVGPLYVMYRTLDDIEALPLQPTPTPLAAEPEATPTPVTLTPEPTRSPFADDLPPFSGDPSSASIVSGFWLALVPPVLLLLGIIALRFLWGHK